MSEETERLAFVIQCETAIDIGRMNATQEYHRGEIEGLRQVYDWAILGENVLDRLDGWQAPESYIRERRQFLAGFRAGLTRGSDIVNGRV